MHLSTSFFLILALITFPANLVSSRSAELVRHWDLAPHTQHQHRPTHAEGDDLHLEDVVLTASVDGRFHAFDRKNGRLKWSMRGTPSGAANQTLLYDLVHSEQAYPHDIHDDGFEFSETYVIEPQSGEIFVLPPGATAHTPLERLPYNIMQLVDLSPFQFPGDDQRMFLGRKETSIVTLDLNSGNVLSVHKPDQCVWEMVKAEPPEREYEHSSDTFEEGSTERPWTKPPPPVTPIRIGRTDYYVSVRIEGKGVVQQLSFSRYGPNNVDRELQSQWIKTPDDRYVQSLPSGDVISFRLSDSVGPDAVDSNRGTVDVDAAEKRSEVSLVAWHGELSKPVVAVFDVLTSPSRNTPFVLIQPQPKLTDIFKDPQYQSQIAQLPDSTFVGLVGHSLYAMSHLAYPMVVFSDALSYNPSASRDGTTELGAPASGGLGHQSHCRTLECYVGTHPSGFAASSRVSRLIDQGKTPPWVDGSPHYTMPVPTPSSTIFLATPSAVVSIPASLGLTWAGILAFALTCITGYIMFFGALGSVARKGTASTPSVTAPDVFLSTGVSNGVAAQGDSTDFSSADPTSLEAPVLDADFNARKDPFAEPGGDLDVEVRRTRRRPRGRHKGRGKKDDTSKDEPEEPDINVPLPSKGETAPPEQQVAPTVNDPFDAASTVSSTLMLTDSILGYGSHGTVVVQGSFQGRAVAVKRLLKDFVTVASREVTLLKESDDHPNVIRYYYQESRDNFLYIALELCPASLEDLIQRPNAFEEINAVFDPKRALSQITAGLQHLHSLKIVHRDIKPQNILFSQAKKGQHRMLISDFGLCKKLESDETSFMPTRHGHLGAGTVGWRAPEILRGEVNLDVSVVESLGGSDSKDGDSTVGSTSGPGLSSASGSSSGTRTRLTKSVDIFALGCLFFYTLTNGEHPFGGPFEREANILKDEKDLNWLERLGEEGVEAQDLIRKMLDPQPRQRLDTTECLVHPFFWTAARRLGFLQDASDRFEIMQRDPPELGLQQLETGAPEVVGGDWVRKFDKIFIDNLGKFRKYNGRSIQDVLRALRNKKHHYQDLPDNVKRHLGPLPDGFLAYFTRRFPALFLHVYYVVANGPLRGESMFQSYFKLQES